MTARKTKSSNVVLLLSGPNLNLLGQREPQIYGKETLDDHVATCRAEAEKHGLTLEHLQSNHEGELIDAIHGARGRAAAIIINAGAFSHYSWAIHDALVTFEGVKVELHLSNPYAREEWRRTSGDRAGGQRDDRRVQGQRLSTRGARSGRAARGGQAVTALPAMDRARRAARVRDSVRDAGCDALLVTRLVNVRWLTGFTGSAALLLVTPDGMVFVSDGRYGEQARDQLARRGRRRGHRDRAVDGRATRRAQRPREGHRPARARGRRRHVGTTAHLSRASGSPTPS